MKNNKGKEFRELEVIEMYSGGFEYGGDVDKSQEVLLDKVALDKIENIVSIQLKKQLEDSMVKIIRTVESEIGNVDKGIGDLHATMLNAYGTQKFKRSMQQNIDMQLENKKVRPECLKDAREFVKNEVFIDGEYQTEKIESSSQYREVSRAIGFAINKCADWRSEWFEDSVSKKDSIEKKLKEMLKELSDSK